MNLPNTITVMRIFLVPVFIGLMHDPTAWRAGVAAGVYVVASLTDWLDGYLARQRDEITRLGKLLDPVADKLLVISGLVLLVDLGRVAAWIAIVIIGRELAVTGLRAIASADGAVIPSDEGGKLKMLLQTLAITCLILDFSVQIMDFYRLGTVLLWLAMIMALASGSRYFWNYWHRVGSGLKEAS